MVKFEYDKEVDALFIWFVGNINKEIPTFDNEIWPKELNDDIGLLYKNDGKLAGIEVLSASKYMKKEYLL